MSDVYAPGSTQPRTGARAPRLTDLQDTLTGVALELSAVASAWPRPDDGEMLGVGGAVRRYAAGPGGRLVARKLTSGADKARWPRRPAGRPGEASTDGRLIYAVGDVHGCYDLLKQILLAIARDAAAVGRGRRPLLLFCGDYIDRGSDAASVLETLCRLSQDLAGDLLLLKGNHEQALLRFLEDPAFGVTWINFGGAATLQSYGVEVPERRDDPAGYEPVRDQLLACMPAAHLRLLQTLDLAVVVGDYAFVHAGVAPGAPLHRQVEADLLWITDEFLGASRDFEKIIVHGHSWVDERPVLLRNRVGVDTGAYATGVLTAVRLDGPELKVIQVKSPGTHFRPRFAWDQGASGLIRKPACYVDALGELYVTGSVASAPAHRLQACDPLQQDSFA